ncbi:uncharacterized protein K452DRAFT_341282 [Aplosporella prunicola CBS 121167]|uniref:Uncharacterized protein n=1 Tax=Aplosporella prunicola CBS 121167 TaxID=1176127 RepID=A0A6A6B1Q6_9PEZI|nr:uncharacterized protein K452DRAFT_341282 [Aplosporella prunicola CBS 121167]KAF2137303.1 hypothetical protein K452DRAFT_341282 [Aplosporella prunicola CBS 121167]
MPPPGSVPLLGPDDWARLARPEPQQQQEQEQEKEEGPPKKMFVEAQEPDRRERERRRQQKQQEQEQQEQRPQPTGDFCLVLGRMSSSVSDQKKKSERANGRLLGRRLGENAYHPRQFQQVIGTFGVQTSGDTVRWEGAPGGFETEIRNAIMGLLKGCNLTVLIRSIDGLTSNGEVFWNFVDFFSRHVKLQILWQCSIVCEETDHPRLVGYRGLGSVLDIPMEEFMAFVQSDGDVRTPNVRRLLQIWWNVNNRKGLAQLGYPHRNEVPDSNQTAARRV